MSTIISSFHLNFRNNSSNFSFLNNSNNSGARGIEQPSWHHFGFDGVGEDGGLKSGYCRKNEQ